MIEPVIRRLFQNVPSPIDSLRAVKEMKSADRVWNSEIVDLVHRGVYYEGLSYEARDFILHVDSQRRSGRMGFLAPALYSMNEGRWPDQETLDEISSQGRLFMFAIRVTDDWFDEYETEIPLETKAIHLNHMGIADGTRTVEFIDHREEASVYLLKKSINRIPVDYREKYITALDDMFRSFYDLECSAVDTSLEAYRRRNYLTLAPFLTIIEPHTHGIKDPTREALMALTNTSTEADNMSDLRRDFDDGAINWLIEDAKTYYGHAEFTYEQMWDYVVQNRNRLYRDIINTLLSGANSLKGIGKNMYLTLGYAMLVKYFVEFETVNKPPGKGGRLSRFIDGIKTDLLGS